MRIRDSADKRKRFFQFSEEPRSSILVCWKLVKSKPMCDRFKRINLCTCSNSLRSLRRTLPVVPTSMHACKVYFMYVHTHICIHFCIFFIGQPVQNFQVLEIYLFWLHVFTYKSKYIFLNIWMLIFASRFCR
jgi:hypothetical protein